MKEATLNFKVSQVNDIAAQMKESSSIVVVNPVGLTVEESETLRKQLHAKGCSLKVVKNNILSRSAEACGYDALKEVLVGPSAVAFCKDANSASKIIYDFNKKNPKLVIKSGVVDGKVLSVDELKVVANLPDKNGMLSMLLSVLQAPIRNVACVIKAVSEK